MSLTVSCVIPVFNGERFLAEAIDSALTQSYAPYEIIVVDDGSTDGTRAVVERYGTRVQYLHQPNRGPAAARNQGIQAAHGDLIAILDADDTWRREKLSMQVGRFEARPELDICMTHMQNFWIEELSEESEVQAEGGGLSIQSLVARRQAFETHGLFDEASRHKDVIGWLMLASNAGAVVETLNTVAVDRRIHHTNLSRNRGSEDGDELLLLARALIRSRRAASA